MTIPIRLNNKAMNNDKLKQIIARKNEQLEHEAVNRASEIINEILMFDENCESELAEWDEIEAKPDA